MNGLLAELGKRLAERWLSLLVLPGALFLAALLAGARLGHGDWYDIAALPGRLDRSTSTHLTDSPAHLLVLLLAFLLASAACGVVAQALGSLLERLWLAADWPGWPTPTHRLVQHRIARRRGRYDRWRDRVGHARAAQHLDGADPDAAALQVAVARHRLHQVADARPDRPTWTGDRLRGVESRLREDLGIDVTVVWPHLWLHAPDTTRAEVTAARETMSRAATLTGWGLLYICVAAVWWPAALIPLTVTTTGWLRFRTATDTYATLVEAATRLHTRTLAHHLGIAAPGPLTHETGTALTAYLTQATPPPPPLRLPLPQ
ncbi:hypothetical protein [Streptomyces sp. TRM68367]|uniref:hypothetical protein n=1 Tax=Streptomyces sp. TRM68367 TaxID=2758415 RepID=UPI00165A9FBD|nr:hypothetical protein [Streptomyces sp. TRM68367]MBC9730206.1 hypothetical protein [Streptomyces sp. TRM68367]